MNRSTTLTLICLFVTSAAFAEQTPDPALAASLEAWHVNGAEAGINALYPDQPDVALQMKQKLLPATQSLGAVIDTEVIAIQTVSKRVTRFYVAVYFSHTPLWIRLERYAGERGPVFLPLRFSFDPDLILPGYLTEFQLLDRTVWEITAPLALAFWSIAGTRCRHTALGVRQIGDSFTP